MGMSLSAKIEQKLAQSGYWIENLARFVAIIGGLALVAIALITLVSVAGRATIGLGFSPLLGQFEMVEAGTLFAISAFLPWCHLKKGHASVGVFTDLMGKRINLFLDFAGDILLAFMAFIMTWQLMLGMYDKIGFGETTFLLGFPVWWSYAAALFGLVTWVIVGIWTSLNSASRIFAKIPENGAR